MDEQKTQLVAQLKEAKNILVTVSRDPSVDQLAAAIGLTLALNQLDKHATAVYSGETPSTLEFLRPTDTLEQTTDSLRDFIIALDKSKADKLRYKVEDQVVRIFITPYHTAISEADLDFSQGDFNVDVVVALGVKTQQDIDEAVQAHGRILHDATVAVLSTDGEPELGTMNVVDSSASSLSEIVLEIIEGMSKKALDSQIATALLTGIVAMTERFSNDRTTPKTMSASATLMAAGANQQLITSQLEAPAPEPEATTVEHDTNDESAQPSGDEADAPKREPGTLEIDHEHGTQVVDDEPAELPAVSDDEPEATDESDQPQIHVDESGKLSVIGDEKQDDGEDLPFSQLTEMPKVEVKRGRMSDEPSFDQPLSANTEEEPYGPPAEQLTQPVAPTPILSHNEHVLNPDEMPVPGEQSPEMGDANEQDVPETEGKTLEEIEQEVDSPHLHSGAEETAQQSVPPALDDARNAIDAAFRNDAVPTYTPEPITALNAQPLGFELHSDEPASAPDVASATPAPLSFNMPEPPVAPPSAFPGAPVPSAPNDDTQPAPPPVPPPMIPPAQ